MEEKDIIRMNIKELRRLQVVNKVLEKRIMQIEAAATLNLSVRQVKRIVRRVKEEGEAGILHKGRGQLSNRAIPNEVRKTILRFYEKKYKDFGPTLAAEKLEGLDNVKVNRETLRGWLIEAGLWKKKRKAREHRLWRSRKEYRGQMVLLDGSQHDWLEGRGHQMVLMGYVDDATGIVYGKFYDYEGTIPALDSLKEYIRTYGTPLSIYVDKHSTYLLNRKLTTEEELEGIQKPLTQFERACKELGIEIIHANSPQAKGRIEREFGTLQDRLVKEMRLAGINNKEQANKFLPCFFKAINKKFSVEPAKEEDFHQKVPAHICLEKILCIKTKRCLRNDNTISFNSKLYLIEDKLVAKTITVEVRTDESIYLNHRGSQLNYRQIELRPKKTEPKAKVSRKPYTPPADHPWRSFSLSNKKHAKQKEVACLAK